MAQKGLPPIRIPRPKVSPPLIFDGKYPLTRENGFPILRTVKSKFLSIINFNQSQALWLWVRLKELTKVIKLFQEYGADSWVILTEKTVAEISRKIDPYFPKSLAYTLWRL
jgi:hypothetical protein